VPYITQAPSPVAVLRPFGLPPSESFTVPVEAADMNPELRSRLKQALRVLQTSSRDAERFSQAATSALGAEAAKTALLHLEHTEEASRRSRADAQRAMAFLLPRMDPDEQSEAEAAVIDALSESAEKLDAGALVWQSHADFFEQIGVLLAVLQTEWLSRYQDAVSGFIEFYQKFSDIMERLKVAASGDKGAVAVDFTAIHLKLTLLARDYALDGNALASFSSKGAAEAFKQSLGLPGLEATGPDANGVYHVKMDLSPVTDLITSMESGRPSEAGNPLPAGHVMDSARYNAWVSAKDSNMEQIKHVSKVLGEKLNEMTQKYDNIVKILSSSIEKMSEANNAYARNT